MKIGKKTNQQDDDEIVPIIAPKIKKKPQPEKEKRGPSPDDDILGFIIPNSPKLSMAVLGGLVLVSSMVGLWAMGVFASPTHTVPVQSPVRPQAKSNSKSAVASAVPGPSPSLRAPASSQKDEGDNEAAEE